MRRELRLKSCECPEDVAEYFYLCWNPSTMHGSFPSRVESEALLNCLEGHACALQYDVRTGKLFVEDCENFDEGIDNLSEFSLTDLVSHCLKLVREFLESPGEYGPDVISTQKWMQDCFLGWLARLELAERVAG